MSRSSGKRQISAKVGQDLGCPAEINDHRRFGGRAASPGFSNGLHQASRQSNDVFCAPRGDVVQFGGRRAEGR